MNIKQIVKALDNTSKAKGIECIVDFNHELGYRGRYINDYLAVEVLSELIDKKIIELKFNEPETEKDKERLEYLKRLLKEK